MLSIPSTRFHEDALPGPYFIHNAYSLFWIILVPSRSSYDKDKIVSCHYPNNIFIYIYSFAVFASNCTLIGPYCVFQLMFFLFSLQSTTIILWIGLIISCSIQMVYSARCLAACVSFLGLPGCRKGMRRKNYTRPVSQLFLNVYVRGNVMLQ